VSYHDSLDQKAVFTDREVLEEKTSSDIPVPEADPEDPEIKL